MASHKFRVDPLGILAHLRMIEVRSPNQSTHKFESTEDDHSLGGFQFGAEVNPETGNVES